MANIPSVKLNSGYSFPLIGYGTFGGVDAPQQVYEGTKFALKAGYRHIDTAFVYRTEDAVGKAIKESGIPREDIFITTKLTESFHRPEHVQTALELSLKNLGTDYVDLYLIHWPFATEFRGFDFLDKTTREERQKAHRIDVPIIDTWRAMEKLVEKGLVRSIGVSNFTIPLLEDLLSKATIPPAVNQVELHPYLAQSDLVEYSKEKGIVLTGYAPLGNPGMIGKFGAKIELLSQPLILKLAEKYKKEPGQVLLNFGLNRGYAVIPKSTNKSRIESNLVYFKMDQEDIDAIIDLDKEQTIRAFDPVTILGHEFKLF
ncbi:NADP-dependent oxidoreductase domain-containing protein [Halteromyces radiatus]|uniref:NADP-dependent oxidoreductase domain-containing protein n=1 Tax=Halteromyces radiatus TaxID=101107 RepID=UPI0022208067|nr:NADP-dependent oxidoreductase domain-containing protein [Halteromyces radiatus]KAI8086006.1 NADP-dependent oxidoreductase domain-containing protein [Halteromyces radiatus]